MLTYQKSHLISTAATVLQHLEEIRAIVIVGKSPTGGRLTPLNEPERSRFLAALDKVGDALRDLLNTLVPEGWQAEQEAGGPSASRMWINILLRTSEELAAEIQPEEMSKDYGKIAESDAERLKDLVDGVQAALRQARVMISSSQGSPEI